MKARTRSPALRLAFGAVIIAIARSVLACAPAATITASPAQPSAEPATSAASPPARRPEAVASPRGAAIAAASQRPVALPYPRAQDPLSDMERDLRGTAVDRIGQGKIAEANALITELERVHPNNVGLAALRAALYVPMAEQTTFSLADRDVCVSALLAMDEGRYEVAREMLSGLMAVRPPDAILQALYAVQPDALANVRPTLVRRSSASVDKPPTGDTTKDKPATLRETYRSPAVMQDSEWLHAYAGAWPGKSTFVAEKAQRLPADVRFIVLRYPDYELQIRETRVVMLPNRDLSFDAVLEKPDASRVAWAEVAQDVLFVSLRSSGDAHVRQEGTLMAVSLATGSLLWESQPGTCTSLTFVVTDHLVICGAGTTREGFVNALSRTTGRRVARKSVDAAPRLLTRWNHDVAMRTAQSDYAFEIR